jgi:hypothetical protein
VARPQRGASCGLTTIYFSSNRGGRFAIYEITLRG